MLNSLKICQPNLVLSTVRPYAVNLRHGRMSEQVPVTMARQHSLQEQTQRAYIYNYIKNYLRHPEKNAMSD